MILGITPFLSILRNGIEVMAYSVLFLTLDKPRFSWKKTIFYYAGFIFVEIVIGTTWVLLEPDSYLKFCTMVLFLQSAVFFSFMSQDRFLQSLYKLTLQMFILLFLLYTGIWISIRFFDGNPWVDIGIRIGYTIVGVFLSYRYGRKPFRKIVDGLRFQWKGICMIAVAGNVLLLFYATRPTHIIVRTVIEQRMFLGTCLLLLVTHMVMLYTLYQMQKEMAYRQEMELTVISNEMLKRELERMQEHVEEANRLRHDMRHHNLMITEYVRRGETAALLDYLETYRQECIEDRSVKICENLVVDHILRSYIRKAEQKGIAVAFQIVIQKEIGIRETDFITILGNIMENAICGCEESKNSQSKIEVWIQQKGGKLVIQVENTCLNQVVFEKGLPVRKNGRGIGIISVVRSVEKYKGDVDFQVNQEKFTVRILLPVLK